MKRKPLGQAQISRILGSEIGGTVGPGVTGAMAGFLYMKQESAEELSKREDSEACIRILEAIKRLSKTRQQNILRAALILLHISPAELAGEGGE
jgi:hypothetical protein